MAEQTLEGHVALAVIPLWFLLRFGLTLFSYGTGAPGGIFAPLLVLGAPFLGRKVKDLALPPDCILVRCYENGREWIPSATTRLEEQMQITAMISPEAANALAVLRRGCESAEHG